MLLVTANVCREDESEDRKDLLAVNSAEIKSEAVPMYLGLRECTRILSSFPHLYKRDDSLHCCAVGAACYENLWASK